VGFAALQESLRRELRRRIAAGEITGTELARKTRFTQAHISNFINGKRGLKLTALDRMEKAIGLTIYDLLDPRELSRHASLPPSKEGEFIDVPVIEAAAAMSPIIVREQIRQILKFRREFLARIRASGVGERKNWTRFVTLQLEAAEAAAMWPEASGRVTLLVDRHYVSLEPFRRGKRDIYAVQIESRVLFRHASPSDAGLVLQPRNSSFPALVAPDAAIIGRVAQASLKT
jgi:transcriptional regulator with XRE-family HTH domain